MRLSILLCSLMLLQLGKSNASYEDTTLAPSYDTATSTAETTSTTPASGMTLPTTSTTTTTPAPSLYPDDGYQVHHAGNVVASHDPYEVIDVAQHAAHQNSAYPGASHVSPPQQAGQTTRYYTDGEVDDSFWLKHLGEDFKHAIHLLVGGNDQYADIYNKTEPGGYMQEVHHEYVPEQRPYHTGPSQYHQQQPAHYQSHPAPQQYQSHQAAPAPAQQQQQSHDYYPHAQSHLSRGYDYSRSLPAAEHSYNESSQHGYAAEPQQPQQYGSADEVAYVPKTQHKSAHYEQQQQQPYESMFKIDESGISNSGAGGYKAAPIPAPPHHHYAAHQYNSHDSAKASYRYAAEKPSYAQQHKYSSVVVAPPAPASVPATPSKTPYTYTYDKQYTAKQKAGTEPVVVTLPEEHGTVVQHSNQDDRPLIVSMPPVIYHSYPRQYANEQQHGEAETEADENNTTAGSGNYGVDGQEPEKQNEQPEQESAPHYTPTHHSYSAHSQHTHTHMHTYSKPVGQYHHQHHTHSHSNSPVHHNTLYGNTQHQYQHQPLTRAQYPAALDDALPDDTPSEPSESASAAAAEQLRNAFKKYSVASFYNPPPFDISNFGNSRLYRGGRGIATDSSTATSAAAAASPATSAAKPALRVPVVAPETAITPAVEEADAAEAASATLSNVYVEKPEEELASSSNLHSTHYLPFQAPFDSYAARVTREAHDLFYKGL